MQRRFLSVGRQWGTLQTYSSAYSTPYTISFTKNAWAVIPVHVAGEYAGISIGNGTNNIAFQCMYSVNVDHMNAMYIAIGI